jgi:hypothetical protein
VLLNNVSTVLRNLVPVDNVPPVGNILGPTVLVFQVVSVFPDIQSKDGVHNLFSDTLHEWVVLVGSSNNFELVTSLVDANPDPSRSKDGTWGCLCLKLGLHLIHGSEGLVNKTRQLVRNLALLGFIRGCHFFPEEGVVIVTTTTVANGTSFQSIGHEVKDRDLGFAFPGLVNVGDIRSMVLIVVKLHGGGINVRFKSCEIIRKVWNKVSVGGSWGSQSGTDSKGLAEDITAASTRV